MLGANIAGGNLKKSMWNVWIFIRISMGKMCSLLCVPNVGVLLMGLDTARGQLPTY
jgi:hypothetical protein